MPKLSLAGFRDPVRRPRFIVWTFVAVFALAAFVIVMLGATSTRWFCAEMCHAVQDDTIRAYQASSHSKISCMACHEPVAADPITFLFKKAKSGLEVIPTVTRTFELPLNAGSALALTGGEEMGSQQCLQCHSENRAITASAEIKIDHQAHAEAGIWCTVCHNRVAHDEVAAPPSLTDPSGHKNQAHPNFMKMDACFRCHDLDNKVKMTGKGAKAAPGACVTCHPADFELLPASHKVGAWTKAHGEVAIEADKKVAEEGAEAKKLEEEGIAAHLASPVNECYTCHSKEKFCTTCHGVEMPHPASFATKHKAPALKDVRKCQVCHLPSNTTTAVRITEIPFCEDCHHKGGQTGTPWLKAHPAVVESKGTADCFKCHAPTVCAKCHVRGGRL